MKVAIIGGGLAGSSAAWALARAGADVEIYEAGETLASAASGNETGLINPRIAAHRTPESDFFTAAYAQAVRTFSALGDDVDWLGCGSLHLINDEKKQKRFYQTLKNWGWPEDEMRLLDAAGASEVAGIEITKECLYLPHAGQVSPRKLCAYYAAGVKTHLNQKIENLADVQADIIILACGAGALNFAEAAWLPLNAVRGQVTHVKATAQSEKIACNLCFGGYMAAANDGWHMVGSTFQRWLDHSDIIEQDDRDNLARLKENIPALADIEFEIIGHRAACRTTSKDHFPIVGPLPDHKNIYVSTAHGSHGLISTLASAHILADLILSRSSNRPCSQSKFTMNCLNPARFCDTPL